MLALLADGLSTKKIAARLGITFKTVASHRAHIMNKLNADKTVTLVRTAIREKLIAP